MDTLSYMQNDADTPVIPLPNPGEGGPVPDGEDESNFPVAPLPNPGEGGPIPDFDESQTPVIPLPNPGEGGPIPTFPERPNNGIWGSIITVFPTDHSLLLLQYHSVRRRTVLKCRRRI